jgi:hypothetical protein
MSRRNKWNERGAGASARSRKQEAVRRELARWGLRIRCCGCGLHARFWPADPHRGAQGRMLVLGLTRDAMLTTHEARRVRDTVCPRCGEDKLRSHYWVARHPELAKLIAER